MEGSAPKAGWYRDPAGSPKLRYWDGEHWTKRLRDRPARPQPTSTATPQPAPEPKPQPALRRQRTPREKRRSTPLLPMLAGKLRSRAARRSQRPRPAKVRTRPAAAPRPAPAAPAEAIEFGELIRRPWFWQAVWSVLLGLCLGYAFFLRQGCSDALDPGPGSAYCDAREAFVYDNPVLVFGGLVVIWIVGMFAVTQLLPARRSGEQARP